MTEDLVDMLETPAPFSLVPSEERFDLRRYVDQSEYYQDVRELGELDGFSVPGAKSIPYKLLSLLYPKGGSKKNRTK